MRVLSGALFVGEMAMRDRLRCGAGSARAAVFVGSSGDVRGGAEDSGIFQVRFMLFALLFCVASRECVCLYQSRCGAFFAFLCSSGGACFVCVLKRVCISVVLPLVLCGCEKNLRDLILCVVAGFFAGFGGAVVWVRCPLLGVSFFCTGRKGAECGMRGDARGCCGGKYRDRYRIC